MKIFIRNTRCISRFKLIDGRLAENEGFEEPAYESLLDPRIMRRLSRILKMGLYTSVAAVNDLNDTIDGIVCGTALGCTADTYAFLMNMIEREEHLLTPTSFIQSTHNTLAGTLGILFKNHGYNMTWCQRSFSFYCALEDAVQRIRSGQGSHYLVCAADEMPASVSDIIQQMDLPGRSTLNAEGAAAFIITNDPAPDGIEIESMDIFSNEDLSLSSLIGQDTLLLNTNPYLSLPEEENVHNLCSRGRSLIDDALALSTGFDMLTRPGGEQGPFSKIAVLSGDKQESSLFKLVS